MEPACRMPSVAGADSKCAPAKETMGLFVPLHITDAKLYAAEGKFHLAHYALDEAWTAVLARKASSWLAPLKAIRCLLYIREGV